MKHNRKMARDNKNFQQAMELFGEINTHLNLDIVTENSLDPIYYETQNGVLRESTVVGLCKSKTGLDCSPIYLARDNPIFMQWYEKYKEFNAHLDLDTLTEKSDNILYVPKSDGGFMKPHVYTICKLKDPNRKPKTCRVKPVQSVLDCDRFLDAYDPSINPCMDSDLSYVSMHSKEPFYFYDTNGKIIHISVDSFCKRNVSRIATEKVLAKDVPHLRKFIEENQALNTHIDINKLNANDGTVPIYYKNKYDDIMSITAHGFLHRTSEDGSAKQYHVNHMDRNIIYDEKYAAEGVCDDEEFLSRLKNADRNKVRHYSRKCGGELTLICPICHGEYAQGISAYFSMRARGQETCPYCDGRLIMPGVNDAGTVSPELYLYYSEKNTVPLHKQFPNGSAEAIWECPDCGAEWISTIYEMKKRKNKCSCRKQEESPIDGAYLYDFADGRKKRGA